MAEEAIRARDDFLAIAAHELRSPLNALALRLAALEKMSADAGQGRLQLELLRARRSVDRYVRRAVFLLDVSRLQAGALRPARTAVGTAELVRNVAEAYASEAEFHGCTLRCEVRDDVTGCWDAHMIEQVLANLVSNAIKYGNATPVCIAAGRAGADSAWFEVSDEGPGIDEQHRRRIFEKFERVVSGGTERAGFGLGLWLVGRMVDAHGGSIEVGGAPGQGTRFRVLLPLGRPADTKQEQQT
jgi:signal transduction histidine kinase